MAAWPASLQQKQFANVTDTRQQATLRSEMDAGAPKVRKRFTAAIRKITIPVVFNAADKATFDTFYITTIAEGAAAFDWTDPNDDSTTISYRFVAPPQFTKYGNEFHAVLNLEVLP